MRSELYFEIVLIMSAHVLLVLHVKHVLLVILNSNKGKKVRNKDGEFRQTDRKTDRATERQSH
jgi:hypothetical protein